MIAFIFSLVLLILILMTTISIKQKICKHEYEMEEYFHGDMKNYGAGIGVCKKCGKRKVIK